MNKQQKFDPVLPFDSSYYDNFIIYDKAPFVIYERSRDRVSEENIMMHHPTLVKYYECKYNDPVPIGGN